MRSCFSLSRKPKRRQLVMSVSPAIPSDLPRFRIRSYTKIPLSSAYSAFTSHHDFNMYTIDVTFIDVTFTLFRRYRELRELHLALSSVAGEVVMPEFPPKIYFRSTSSAVADLRRVELEELVMDDG